MSLTYTGYIPVLYLLFLCYICYSYLIFVFLYPYVWRFTHIKLALSLMSCCLYIYNNRDSHSKYLHVHQPCLSNIYYYRYPPPHHPKYVLTPSLSNILLQQLTPPSTYMYLLYPMPPLSPGPGISTSVGAKSDVGGSWSDNMCVLTQVLLRYSLLLYVM